MWNVIVHKNNRMVWIERDLRDDPTPAPATAGPPPTAPAGSKAQPGLESVTGVGFATQIPLGTTSVPTGDPLYSFSLMLLGLGPWQQVRPGLFAKFHPARVRIHHGNPERLQRSWGSGRCCRSVSSLELPPGIPTFPLSPAEPQEGQTGVGQGSELWQGTQPPWERPRRGTPGGTAAPAPVWGHSSVSRSSHHQQSSLPITACPKVCPLYSPTVGTPPLLAHPPCANEL